MEKIRIEKLLQLIRENPNLPVVPLVDSSICEDECYPQYMGDIGSSWVGKYVLGKDRFYLYDIDPYEMLETISDILGINANESTSGKTIQQIYDNLPWIEAIFVDICMPIT